MSLLIAAFVPWTAVEAADNPLTVLTGVNTAAKPDRINDVIPAARFVDSNVIWRGSERYDSASPLDGGDSDDRRAHSYGALGG